LCLSEDTGQATLPSPSLLNIGSQLAALGVPPQVILDEYEVLRDEATKIAGLCRGQTEVEGMIRYSPDGSRSTSNPPVAGSNPAGGTR